MIIGYCRQHSLALLLGVAGLCCLVVALAEEKERFGPAPDDRGKGPRGRPGHRFVATVAGQVTGWVAASAVSGRCVYAGAAERPVYVHPAARSLGIGRRLLNALIASTEAAGIWTIQNGIFPENTASLALHLAAGLRVVGTRERIGRHHGRWRDTLLIERRSGVV